MSEAGSGKPPAIEDVPPEVGAQIRTCIGCIQADNHPKIHAGPLDGPPVYWHHDCFVISKQPGWEDFAALIEGANGATGHALREHLIASAPTGEED